MIELCGDFHGWVLDQPGTSVSIGVYDGVHRGHQAILRSMKERSDFPLAVVTFSAHPAAVVTPTRAPRLLMTVSHRLELLESYGVDVLALLDFDERLRYLPAVEFVEKVLLEALRMKTITVGEGFRFGYELLGDVSLLRQLGSLHGFDVCVLPILEDEEPIRSTTIRAALAAGDVERAADLLGRPFQMRSEVMVGDKRGGPIGFPTANLEPPQTLVRPRWGVYAAWAGLGVADHPAVVNVGVRPTIDGKREVVEVHLLEVDMELYGKELHVDFIARLREEERFPSIDALVTQISSDAVQAKKVLLGGAD